MKKQVLINRILIASTIVLFILLIAFRDKISDMVAESKKEALTENLDKKEKKKFENEYIYSGNEKYDFTFLEFGAKSCVQCKKMEEVMQVIKETHPEVNVVFHNVTTKEGQEYADFYGIVLIPVQVVLDKNGKEIFRHEGYISAEDLAQNFK